MDKLLKMIANRLRSAVAHRPRILSEDRKTFEELVVYLGKKSLKLLIRSKLYLIYYEITNNTLHQRFVGRITV